MNPTSPAAASSLERSETAREVVGLHPHVVALVPEAAELLAEPHVRDPARRQLALEPVAREVRVPSRLREAADVRDRRDARAEDERDEVLERLRRMTEGPVGRHGHSVPREQRRQHVLQRGPGDLGQLAVRADDRPSSRPGSRTPGRRSTPTGRRPPASRTTLAARSSISAGVRPSDGMTAPMCGCSRSASAIAPTANGRGSTTPQRNRFAATAPAPAARPPSMRLRASSTITTRLSARTFTGCTPTARSARIDRRVRVDLAHPRFDVARTSGWRRVGLRQHDARRASRSAVASPGRADAADRRRRDGGRARATASPLPRRPRR